MLDMENIFPKFALYGSKNKCVMTGTVFFPIYQVCNRGVTLVGAWDPGPHKILSEEADDLLSDLIDENVH